MCTGTNCIYFSLLVNIDNKVGAIGFVSRIIPAVYPISIIRVDPETGDPIRNSKGLCITCKPGECNFKVSF
jgi:solute carrier family 27 fatty acid transporter 1/4